MPRICSRRHATRGPQEPAKGQLQFKKPIRELRQLIDDTLPATHGPKAIVTLGHLQHALKLYSDGTVTRGDLEKWAEVIEMRDDITRDVVGSEVIEAIVSDLATPEWVPDIDVARLEGYFTAIGRYGELSK